MPDFEKHNLIKSFFFLFSLQMVSTRPQYNFCHECDNYFIRATNFRVHQQSANCKKQNRCYFCGDTFGYSYTSYRNLKNQHKDLSYPTTSSVVSHHPMPVSLRESDQAISTPFNASIFKRPIPSHFRTNANIKGVSAFLTSTAITRWYPSCTTSHSSGNHPPIHKMSNPDYQEPIDIYHIDLNIVTFFTVWCNRSTSLGKLKRHINNAHGNQNYACGVRGQFYTYFDALTVHTRTQHAIPQKPTSTTSRGSTPEPAEEPNLPST